ncbi:MAG: recombinase family protein [Candidatus Xenobiia bacterium LiM19]
MKVIGYARVSTEEQATSGVSLQAQVEKLCQYASLYDLELVAVIEDGGQSAKTLNRPGIQQALQMMRNGEVSGLLVAKLDRLTRSIVDLNTLISDYFSEKARYQASLFSVADQVDTRSAGGRLVLNVLMSVAQWEREAIGERTKAALSFKKSQGVKLGRPEKQITDPDEIRTVNYIHLLRDQGLTFRAIAVRLDVEGYKTSRGGKWAPQTVKNLLESEVA